MYQEAKPKKLRKKVKPSAMIRPQKRSKKKKRNNVKVDECVTEVAPIHAGKKRKILFVVIIYYFC